MVAAAMVMVEAGWETAAAGDGDGDGHLPQVSFAVPLDICLTAPVSGPGC